MNIHKSAVAAVAALALGVIGELQDLSTRTRAAPAKSQAIDASLRRDRPRRPS